MRKAVAKNGVIDSNELITRFAIAANLSVSEKTKAKWLRAIKSTARENGLYFFESLDSKLNITEKVTLHRDVPTKEYALKSNVYTDVLKKAIKDRKVESIEVHSALREAGFNPRTLERKIASLKKIAYQCGLDFFKEGRKLMVRLSKVVPYPVSSLKNTPQKMEPLYIDNKLKRELTNRNTGKPAFRLTKNLNKKAHWLSKQLKYLFWDNCKVEFNYGCCYNFIKWALVQGFEEKKIKNYFDFSLHQRHQDATDLGINTQNFTLKFKLSSTVSLAKKMLMERCSNESREQRIEKVISFLKEKNRSSSTDKNPVSSDHGCLPSKWKMPSEAASVGFLDGGHVQKETEGSVVKQNTLPYPFEFEQFALDQGFSNYQLSLFASFLSASPAVRNSFISADHSRRMLFSSLSALLREFTQLSA